MDTYNKSIAEGSFEERFYQALGFPPVSGENDTSLVLRITLGDMELLDGFYISLPEDAAGISIEDMLAKYVLPEGEEGRTAIKKNLALDPNPDLLEIYDNLIWIYEQAEAGDFTISYHINNGASDIPPSDPVSLHQQTCETDSGNLYHLLDLVLEVYDNIDPFSGMTDEQKEAMIRDFESLIVLYLMDRFGYQPETQKTDRLSSILQYLSSEEIGLIHFEEIWSITSAGYEFLGRIIDEVEFYIDNYDIFGDVYIKGTDIIFGTDHGENLIVPVFMREGIDPYKALFIAALYLGNLDDLIADLTTTPTEHLFRELFSLIPHSPTAEEIGAELLDRIIREGKLIIEKRQLREQRLEHIEKIQRRIDDE